MGIKLLSKCGCEDETSSNDFNPNPIKFYIKRILFEDRFVIAYIKYFGCTNFEGNKILVFENISVEELMLAKKIDPHFCENCRFSPIARFVPTEIGWIMAKLFVTGLINYYETPHRQ